MSTCLRYSEARLCLLREQEKVGLTGLSLHSGRVGGATEASEEEGSGGHIHPGQGQGKGERSQVVI